MAIRSSLIAFCGLTRPCRGFVCRWGRTDAWWFEAPADASDATIGEVVKRRSRWIHEHLRSIADRKTLHCKRDWVSGESHRYLGRRSMLEGSSFAPAEEERVVLAGEQLQGVRGGARSAARSPPCPRVVSGTPRTPGYRNRVSELAKQLPWVRKAPSVAIRQMKSRWSCSPAGQADA